MIPGVRLAPGTTGLAEERTMKHVRSDLDGPPLPSAEQIAEARGWLPAWFIGEMMGRPAKYGLMLANGYVLAIERITAVNRADNGAIWLDVRLLGSGESVPGILNRNTFVAPDGVLEASVNAAAVCAAFGYERAD
jgi:hypothetical protein